MEQYLNGSGRSVVVYPVGHTVWQLSILDQDYGQDRWWRCKWCLTIIMIINMEEREDLQWLINTLLSSHHNIVYDIIEKVRCQIPGTTGMMWIIPVVSGLISLVCSVSIVKEQLCGNIAHTQVWARFEPGGLWCNAIPNVLPERPLVTDGNFEFNSRLPIISLIKYHMM